MRRRKIWSVASPLRLRRAITARGLSSVVYRDENSWPSRGDAGHPETLTKRGYPWGRVTLSTTVRIGLAAAAAVGAASLAALAGGASSTTYKPYLYVSPASAGSVQFEIRRGPTDLATYDADIRVPFEYGARLDQPVGTVVGRVAADTLVRGASAPYTGTLTVGKAAPNNGCFSVTSDDTAWNVTLANGTRSFAYQVYVRAFAGDVTMLRYCLPPDSLDLDSISYTIAGVFKQPARGNYAWRGQFYPYTATGEVVDNAAGVGAAALMRLPHVVALAASYSRRSHRYVLSGSVTEGGLRVSQSSVLLSVATKSHAFRTFARVKTDKRGSFTYSGKLSARNLVRFRAHAQVAGRVISPPHCPSINGWPCVSETVSWWANDSRAVSVRP
jgi:hypothetical protein